MSLVHDLYRHMSWADATVWDTVVRLPAAPDQRVRGLMFHLHLTQHAFLKLWCGERVVLPEIAAFPTPESLRAWGRDFHQEVLPFLAALDGAALDQPRKVPWAKLFGEKLGRPPSGTTLGETLFQVPFHSTYHRGQVNARLRACELDPPLVDYIAWIWFGRPDPIWPTT